MKITGWIFVVLGALSFLGAALKGNNTFGPLFWIALGSYLIYRANKKSEEAENAASTYTSEANVSTLSSSQDETLISSESLDDIHSNLTTRQKEAAMCLIAFFGGYNDNQISDAMYLVFRQVAVFFGLPDTPEKLSQIMSKYDDADALIDIVLTIRHKKSKEFLLLTCYDLTKMSDRQEPFEILVSIANEMGYDREQFQNLVNQYS